MNRRTILCAILLITALRPARSDAAPFAYIAWESGIDVIDTATDTVVTTMATTLGSQSSIGITPSGAYAYITSYGGQTLVVDTSTQSIVETIPHDFFNLTMHPTGNLVYGAPHLGGGNVAVISTATRAIVATIGGFVFPTGIAAHPAGAKVYVVDQPASNVKVISTGTSSIIETIPIDGIPLLVAFNPSGSKAFVTYFGGPGFVAVIDTATDQIVDTISVSQFTSGMAFLPDGSKMYVSNPADDTVSVVDTATNTVTATIPVGDYPQGVDVLSDGSKLYVVNVWSNNVSVIDTATNTVLSTIAVGNHPNPEGAFIEKEQSSTAATATVATGTMTVSFESLTGTLDFDPGPFSVFGTAVDIDNAIAGVPMDVSFALSQAAPYGFDISATASSSTLPSFSLAGAGQMSFNVGNPHLTIPLQQPSGTVLPNGPIYSLVADIASQTLSGPFVLSATLAANTPAVPGATVPVTTTVQVCPGGGAVLDLATTVTFSDVSTAGSTTVTGTCRTPASIPPNIRLDVDSFHFFFDVTTTASFTPPVTICISYPDNDDNGFVDYIGVDELKLTLLHDAGGGGSFAPASNINIDAVNNRICGDADSLSPFLIAATGVPKGFVPPDSDARSCEHKLLNQSAKFLKAIINCNRKAADAVFRGKTFDAAACEAKARSAYDGKTAGLVGCPPCLLVNAEGVRDATEGAAEALTSSFYCAGTTLIGSDELGFVPSDEAGALCAKQQGKSTAKLGKKLGKCYRKNVDAAFQAKSFDLDACLADEGDAFDTAFAAIGGCPACAMTSTAAIRNQMERFSAEILSDVYCAGTSALP